MFKFAVQSILLIIAGLIIVFFSGCDLGMTHAKCDDTPLSRIASPDGTLFITTFHRSCSSGTGLYTYARVEKPRAFWQSKGDEYCYLTTWSGFHPIEAVWTDANSITISTPDALKDSDFSTRNDICQSIKVNYDVKIKPRPAQNSDNPKILENIKKVLAKTEPCMREKISSYHVDSQIYDNLKDGQHRRALEFIFTYVNSGKCPISQETYDLMAELAESFDLESFYVEQLKERIEP